MILAWAAAAQAQSSSEADIAFRHGRAFMEAGKFEEACLAFEKSQQLDPTIARTATYVRIPEGRTAAEVVRDPDAPDARAS